jgi:hypothetical protein
MNEKSRYFSKEGSPKLRMSYCVFMDILGFRKLVIDSFKEADYQDLFEKFYWVISSEGCDPNFPSTAIPAFDWLGKVMR